MERHSFMPTAEDFKPQYIPPQITLRAYFAAAALQGIVLSDETESGVERDCRDAFRYADAMIAEMNKEAKP